MVKSSTEHSSRMKKASKRRLRLLAVVFFCFVGWAAVTLAGEFHRYEQKKSQYHALQKQLNDVEKQNSSYNQQLKQLDDPEYIEQVARQQYHYVKPGETLFYVPDSTP